jgi:alcohol dehydrogenase, propanol-preferring
MRAVRVQDGEVRVVDVPEPSPGPGEALVRIASAGVCHSDLHLARGDWFGMQVPELGHEAIGTVTALGPGAEESVQLGDRVILGLGGSGGGFWCGACEYCLAGSPRHCTRSRPIMGVFAEQFAVYAPGLVVLPDEIGDRQAPLACGGLTAYGAVKKLGAHGVGPGSWVAIFGAAGGLGHYGVQLCSAFGYRILAVDVGPERLAFATTLGAERAVEPGEIADAAAEVGGVHASLVFSARIESFQAGLDVLRKAGLFVGVGLPPTGEGDIRVNPFTLLIKDPTIVFSGVGTVQDMREVVDLAAHGVVTTHVSRTGTLTELPQIFEELHRAAFLGRAVITDMEG